MVRTHSNYQPPVPGTETQRETGTILEKHVKETFFLYIHLHVWNQSHTFSRFQHTRVIKNHPSCTQGPENLSFSVDSKIVHQHSLIWSVQTKKEHCVKNRFPTSILRQDMVCFKIYWEYTGNRSKYTTKVERVFLMEAALRTFFFF